MNGKDFLGRQRPTTGCRAIYDDDDDEPRLEGQVCGKKRSKYVVHNLSHSPTFPPLHLRQNSFSNPSVALPTSQLISTHSVSSPTSQCILQPFFRFSYVTGSSPNSPGEPPKGKFLKYSVTWQITLFSLFI